MRKHTFEATKGQTYAEMGRFVDAKGNPTTTRSWPRRIRRAASRRTTRPPRLGDRDGVEHTLNTAYFAESGATFAIVMGLACC
jgi:hypothetical protein